MHLKERVKRSLLGRLLPVPAKARHAEYSMIFSADDEPSRASPRLLSVALDAITRAQHVSLSDISARLGHPPYYPDIWPGESYKLLAGFVLTLEPKLVVELGTGVGTSALSMKRCLPTHSRLITFDVIHWKSYPGHLFIEDDLADGRLVQHTDDLTRPEVFAQYRTVFEEADLMFIDAAKDGVMEQTFIEAFSTVAFRRQPLIIFDDIRVWNMLKIWRNLPRPKLDLTSFGHWTGTGLVEWSARPSASG